MLPEHDGRIGRVSDPKSSADVVDVVLCPLQRPSSFVLVLMA